MTFQWTPDVKGLRVFFIIVMGKAEGHLVNEQWHGHVTCLSVANEFRRLGLAGKLMKGLEDTSEK